MHWNAGAPATGRPQRPDTSDVGGLRPGKHPAQDVEGSAVLARRRVLGVQTPVDEPDERLRRQLEVRRTRLGCGAEGGGTGGEGPGEGAARARWGHRDRGGVAGRPAGEAGDEIE